jgi:hypothetical protein
MVGLQFSAATLSLGVVGAFSPTVGVVPDFMAEGDIHDQNSLCHVISNARYVYLSMADVALLRGI